ncbi:MAG: Wzz/FepE/Etk N-terminal domain-containing protein, partial [Geminicoccaceae bacterium]
MAMSTRHQRATHVVHAAHQPAGGGMAHAHSNLAVANHGTEWLDLREMTRKLWRGRRMIAVLTILGTVVGAAAISQLEEAYTATNTIMLETREREVFDAKAVLQNLSVSDAIVESEVEVLQSRELIKRVALELGAYEDEELTKGFYETEPEGWLAEVKELVKTQISSLMADDSIDDLAALAASADDEASELQKTVIDAMYDRLSVEGGGEVPVIRVSYTSEDPRKAAAHANAFAQTYISTQVEVKSDATRQASGWLKDRIALLQKEVEEKERQVEDLRSEVGILDGTLNDVSVASQQAAELSSQHIAAMLERQRAEAALEQNVETELLASPVLQ